MAERLDAFMARANAAYYAASDPFADFTTAPEISQAFGEVLGAWVALVWQAMGRPAPVLVAEAGPGRGTLMADARRLWRRVMPDLAMAARLHFIETSPRLRAIQQQSHPDASWCARLEDVPPGPLLLLANEFLDALPIRQFVRRADGWREYHVADGARVELPAPPDFTAPADHPPGSVVEQATLAGDFVAALSRRLVTQGGVALILDYGPEASGPGDSLQALRGGRPADPFAEAGSADLTAHVDFAALAAIARAAGAVVHGPVPQGLFLARLGLAQRAERLAAAAGSLPRALAQLAGTRRLLEPDQMGRLFKVLALCQPGLPALEGFTD